MSRKARYLLSTAVGTAAVTALLSYMAVTHASPSRAPATAAIPISLTPSESAGGALASSAPSELRRVIVASTYRELGRYSAANGQLVSVFRGVSARDRSSCFGLTTHGASSLSCSNYIADPLQVSEFTVTGHTMLGGVVSDLVDKVVVKDVGGSDVPLEISGGAFFFDGGQGHSVVAYDRAGQIIGDYDLQGTGG